LISMRSMSSSDMDAFLSASWIAGTGLVGIRQTNRGDVSGNHACGLWTSLPINGKQ
jgi:hypothetical protein